MALNKDINVGSSTIAQYTNTINNRNYTNKIYTGGNITNNQTINNTNKEINKSFFDRALGVYSSTRATIATGVISVTEGLYNWGEKVADGLKTVSYYGVGKIFQAVGAIDEAGFNDVMNEAKAEIAEDDIKYVYDYWIWDTEEGSKIRDAAYGYDTARSIGNTVGEVGMNIGIAAAGGVGAMAASGGVTGFGEGVSTAYKNGATAEQGIAAGAATGAWNAAQNAIGFGINKFMPFEKEIANAFLHVGLDAVDGGAEGFVQPLIEMIYKDSDETGFGRYKEAFNEAGGWSNVGVQSAMGGAMSFLGERSGIAKWFREKSDVKNSLDDFSLDVANKFDKLGQLLENADEDLIRVLNNSEKGFAIDLTNVDIEKYKEISSLFNQLKRDAYPDLKISDFINVDKKISINVDKTADLINKLGKLVNNTDYDVLEIFEEAEKGIKYNFSMNDKQMSDYNEIKTILEELEKLGNDDIKISDFMDLDKTPVIDVNDFQIKVKEQIEKDKVKNDILNQNINRINTTSQVNGLKLKHEITEQIDKNLDSLTKARKAYVELNKRLAYDANYLSGSKSAQDYNRKLSFDSLNSRNVVCSDWSQLYKEILEDIGFEPSQVKIQGSGHKWIEISLDDGNIIIADATEALNNSVDLANCKFGFATTGFVYMDGSCTGLRLKNICFTNKDEKEMNRVLKELDKIADVRSKVDDVQKLEELSKKSAELSAEYEALLNKKNGSIDLIDVNKKQWSSTDSNIGYMSNDSYFDEKIKQANQLFGNSSSFDNVSSKDIDDILMNIELDDGVDGYSAYAYYNKMRNLMYTDEMKKPTTKIMYYKTENAGYETVLGFLNSSNDSYMIYSETLGKIKFNDYGSYIDFIKQNLQSYKK